MSKKGKISNNYSVEPLEPRFMMDATINDWSAESSLIDDNLLFKVV